MKLNDGNKAVPEEVGLMRVYKTPSSVSTEVNYFFGQALGVGMDQPTDYFCSCPGFHFRGTCKHVDSLKES